MAFSSLEERQGAFQHELFEVRCLLVIDKRLGFWEAMELSRKAVTRRWWSLFALCLLAGLVSASGLLACCVGVFASIPIGIAAILYAYEDIFGSQTTAQVG